MQNYRNKLTHVWQMDRDRLPHLWHINHVGNKAKVRPSHDYAHTKAETQGSNQRKNKQQKQTQGM
jgi:hypothetical protein